MKRRRLNLYLFFVVGFLLGGLSGYVGASPPKGLLITSAVPDTVIYLEHAITPESQRKGLMFRLQLPLNSGMLFHLDPPTRGAIWMKNTMISLDIIWLDYQYRIVDMVEETVPFSFDIVMSDVLASYILEVNRGSIRRWGIQKGDMVTPVF